MVRVKEEDVDDGGLGENAPIGFEPEETPPAPNLTARHAGAQALADLADASVAALGESHAANGAAAAWGGSAAAAGRSSVEDPRFALSSGSGAGGRAGAGPSGMDVDAGAFEGDVAGPAEPGSRMSGVRHDMDYRGYGAERHGEDGYADGDGYGDQDGDGDDMGGDDDDDDPIVQEFDVYLSNEMSDSLYLLQFPTRPHTFTSESIPKEGRIKYKHKKLQLDVELDITGGHYDHQAGERFGQGLHNKPLLTAFDLHSRGFEAERTLLKHIKLESKIVPLNAQYMIGVLRHRALHLRPISTILQLRQSLDYIDKINEKEKNASQRIMHEERKEEGIEDEAKMIQVMVRSSDDKEASKRASVSEMQRQSDSEQWTPLSIKGPEHEDSEHFRRLIGHTDVAKIDFDDTSKSYIDTISPLVIQQQQAATNPAASKADAAKAEVRQGMSVAEMAHLPLADKCKALLLNAHVVQHSTIVNLIGDPGIGNRELIKALTDVAYLIRGVWVIKSELLYTGRAYDARRFLLGLLNSKEYVSRKEFVDITHLLPNMAANMLNEIADLDEGLGWRLKVPPDSAFVENHDRIVESQRKLVEDEMHNSTTGSQNAAQVLDAAKLSGGGASAQLDALIKALFHAHPLCTMDFVTRSFLLSKYKSVGFTRDQISLAVESMCLQVSGGYALKTGASKLAEKFRPAIFKLFAEKGRARRSEIQAKCVEEGLGEIPHSAYIKIMSEIATSDGTFWQLKPMAQ
nr:DNA-directed RNA polymerase III subunit RPC5 [Polyrhizophydium stewartii]